MLAGGLASQLLHRWQLQFTTPTFDLCRCMNHNGSAIKPTKVIQQKKMSSVKFQVHWWPAQNLDLQAISTVLSHSSSYNNLHHGKVGMYMSVCLYLFIYINTHITVLHIFWSHAHYLSVSTPFWSAADDESPSSGLSSSLTGNALRAPSSWSSCNNILQAASL